MKRAWWREYGGLLVALGLTVLLALACVLKGHAQTLADTVAEAMMTHQWMAAAGLHRTTSNEVSVTILARDGERLYDSGGRLNVAATAQWMEEPECVTLTPEALYHEPLPHWRVRMVGYVYGAGLNFIDVMGGDRLVRCWHTSGRLYPAYKSVIIVEGHCPALGRIAVSSIAFPVQGGS